MQTWIGIFRQPLVRIKVFYYVRSGTTETGIGVLNGN